jgi:leader peptidase (prepilin peptidase)/N-methyltransferase
MAPLMAPRMAILAALPLSVRLLAVGLMGMVLGSLVNWAIYRLAWNRRDISPWGPKPSGAAPRGWADRIPVLGWLWLRREHQLHGRGFWVRPVGIEVALGLGLAALYWWEVAQQGILCQQIQNIFVGAGDGVIPLALPVVSDGLVHTLFLGHALLIVLMAAASFIDIDEKIIPDEITVPGTLLGLVLMTALPMALLPHVQERIAPPVFGELVTLPPAAAGINMYAEPVTLTAPNVWSDELNGWQSLAVAQACWWMWCFALTPRIWRGRRGVCRALAVIGRRVLRELTRPPLGAIAAVGCVAIAAVWWLGGAAWVGLATALLGMAVSGGMVWVVRLVGSWALGREAMGFGDVTLMMMVGTFVGWQAGVVIFFVAPLAALVIGIVQLVLNHDDVIPYGPFLCLGTLAVVVKWPFFWSLALQDLFSVGWLMPAVLVVSFSMLGVMLLVWQQIKMALFGRHHGQDEED